MAVVRLRNYRSHSFLHPSARRLQSWLPVVSGTFFDSAGPFKEFMIAAFATFASLERAKISERTLAGLAKAKSQGRVGGRPKAEDDPATVKAFRRLKESGTSVRGIAAQLGISPTTVQKLVSASV